MSQATVPAGPVAVLGANGFVGRSVVAALAESGATVRAVVRPGAPRPFPAGADVHELGAGGWEEAVAGCARLVHLVARTHRLGEAPGAESEAAYGAVNVDLTRSVLEAATRAGVQRVLYMSSVKAMGESRDVPYTEDDEPRPRDAYGRTKLAAERLVLGAGMSAVVLRPPLVYGPGAAGNVARLVRAVQRGVPLPLGRAQALRSLVAVTNLADAVREALLAEVSGVYLVADAEALSVRAVIEALAEGCDRPARLVPVPVPVLRAAGRATGRGDEVDRLVRPLVLDTSRFRRDLGWSPPVAAADGLRATAAAVR